LKQEPLKNKRLKQKTSSFILFLLFFLFDQTTQAQGSYIKCWKDKEGVTECGNRIPREFYNQRVRYIDESGVTRKIKEKAKTREELEIQQEQELIRKQEEKQQQKIKNHDEILLKTYLTIDDLLSALNSKLDLIKSQSVILDANITQKKRSFSDQVKKAADIERSGRPIPDNLAKQLDITREGLKNLQLQVIEHKEETLRINKVFAHDVERFIQNKSKRIKHIVSSPRNADKLHASFLSCQEQEQQCELFWQKAINFIKNHATTEVLYQTKLIAVTSTPKKNNDIAMRLSLLDGKSESEKLIIFQIRCKRTRVGEEFCGSDEIKGLLKEFRSIPYQ